MLVNGPMFSVARCKAIPKSSGLRCCASHGSVKPAAENPPAEGFEQASALTYGRVCYGQDVIQRLSLMGVKALSGSILVEIIMECRIKYLTGIVVKTNMRSV